MAAQFTPRAKFALTGNVRPVVDLGNSDRFRRVMLVPWSAAPREVR